MQYSDKLKEVDELRAAIAAHSPLRPDVLKKVNYKFRLEWNYTSNSMEGNSLTRSETRSVMIGNITVHGKPIKDVLEMKGHDEVITSILKMGAGELQLSETRIRDIHRGIMHEEDPEKAVLIGKWKTQDNYLFNYRNERIDFTPHADAPDAMHRLTDWLSAQREKIARGDADALHPALLAFRFHLDYVSIHPFYDGNGRTARILTNLILIAYGYPPVWVREDERNAYYQYLADVQGYGGSPDVFYELMAELLLRSQQLMLDAAEGKEIEEPSDYLKELELVKRRVANEIVPKSPVVVYDIFTDVQTTVWKPLQSLLHSFDDLFNESKDAYEVNRRPQRYKTETKNLFMPFERVVSNAPEPVTIYGHDIYKVDVKDISWEQKKYALKGATSVQDFRILSALSFAHQSYTLSISATSDKESKTPSLTKVAEVSKQYNSPWSEEEVEALKTALGKYLVSVIQTYLNAEQP